MKKVITLIAFICFVNFASAETIDSLKSRRELLYSKYLDINIPGKQLNKTETDNSLSLLKELIIIDSKIIKEFSAADKKFKEYDSKINTLNNENDLLSRELSSSTDYIMIINIAGGIIVVLLIISLIMCFNYYIKYNKLRKGIK